MFKYADYIYKVYEAQSFTLAAKELFISQPALSAIIKKAEEDLGFKVFNRDTMPISLTDLGHIYISSVEEMHRIEQNLRDGVNNVISLLTGEIKVSGAAFISSFVLPKIIMDFANKHPKINIQLIENNSVDLQEKLFSEEIEILIDYDFDSTKFVAFPLMEEQILLSVPRMHPLNKEFRNISFTAEDIISNKHLNKDAKCVDLSFFKNENFIQLKPKNNMYKCSCQICSECGFTPKSIINVDQLMTAYNISGSGMGLTFTTDTVIRSAAQYENLLFYKLGGKYAQRTMFITYKNKKYINPAVSEFVKIAREIYG